MSRLNTKRAVKACKNVPNSILAPIIETSAQATVAFKIRLPANKSVPSLGEREREKRAAASWRLAEARTQVWGSETHRGVPEVRPRVTRHAPQAPTKLFEAKGKDRRAADRCCHPNGGVDSGVKCHSSAAMHEGKSGLLVFGVDHV